MRNQIAKLTGGEGGGAGKAEKQDKDSRDSKETSLVQGVSSAFDIMYLALADRSMQVRFGLKVVWES